VKVSVPNKMPMKGLLTYRTFQFSMSSVPQNGTKIFRYRRLPWVTVR
jgi:hypothetical protein